MLICRVEDYSGVVFELRLDSKTRQYTIHCTRPEGDESKTEVYSHPMKGKDAIANQAFLLSLLTGFWKVSDFALIESIKPELLDAARAAREQIQNLRDLLEKRKPDLEFAMSADPESNENEVAEAIAISDDVIFQLSEALKPESPES